MAKRLVITEVTEDSVNATFENGTQVSYKIDELQEDMKRRCALHGLKQKLFDAIAGAGAEPTASRIAEVNACWDSLKAGDWNRGRTGEVSIDTLVLAVVRVTGHPEDKVRPAIAAMTTEGRAALRGDPNVQVEIKKIGLEKAEAAASAKATSRDALAAMFG